MLDRTVYLPESPSQSRLDWKKRIRSDKGVTLKTSALESLQWPNYLARSGDKTKYSGTFHLSELVDQIDHFTNSIHQFELQFMCHILEFLQNSALYSPNICTILKNSKNQSFKLVRTDWCGRTVLINGKRPSSPFFRQRSITVSLETNPLTHIDWKTILIIFSWQLALEIYQDAFIPYVEEKTILQFTVSEASFHLKAHFMVFTNNSVMNK